MKFLIVVAAFLAVAFAAPDADRAKRGAVLLSNGGTIISSPGVVASSVVAPGLIAPGLVSNQIIARSVLSSGLVTNGLVAPGIVAPGLFAPGLLAPGLVASRSIISNGVVLANPGVTAGTVVAPGATLVGPNTNGAPGAVITNGLLGPQILV